MGESYVMQVAEAVRDAVKASAYICGSPLSMQFIGHDPVDLPAVIASVPVPTDSAAARIAELEREQEAERKRANAQNMLIKSQEKQLTTLYQEKDKWREAINTLDSERLANNALTTQVAELERQLEQSKNINKQLMLNRDAAFAECRAKTIEECAQICDENFATHDCADAIREPGEKK